MTVAREAMPPLATLARAVRRLLPAPLGWHTRYMIASYARHTFLVTCAILVLALSIDLTFFLAKIIATVADWRGFWPLSLAWFVILRGTDFLAELLPVACFGGVFWAEIAHTVSQERLVVWLSGRAVQQCLVPALLFGTVTGVAELALNIYLRPLAVMTMAADHLGLYGERFDPRPLPYPQWIASGHDLVQAFVEPGSPPTLRDVKIYRMDERLALHSVYRAKLAKPLDDHSWMLIDGNRWVTPLAAERSEPAAEGQSLFESEQEVAFAQQSLDLSVAPIWLNTFRIDARYLTNDVFKALMKVSFSPNSEFRTWEHARYSMSLYCAAMPLLAAALSTLLLAYEVRLGMLCIIAVAGYMANSAMKLFILLGEHGHLSPAVAAWSVPTFLLLICAMALALRSKVEAARARFSAYS